MRRSSSTPRSRKSPRSTATVWPLVQRQVESARPPRQRVARDLGRSPWRPPMTTRRRGAGMWVGRGDRLGVSVRVRVRVWKEGEEETTDEEVDEEGEDGRRPLSDLSLS
ncbi:hypothetical protein IHE45_13G047600 [Dioscorea alata]|uniref:Uncharacterized protein n=1 Tax=Dioscorea alata TaxID=55571 RepID=A0ACB7UXM9_DIOAL|nr:hypothetical protein IHE45_13G047600 [Dioscorea alata]